LKLLNQTHNILLVVPVYGSDSKPQFAINSGAPVNKTYRLFGNLVVSLHESKKCVGNRTGVLLNRST